METSITYVPPDFISEFDDDIIHARMMDNLPPDIDKTEGGFAHDFTRPAAIEKAEILITMNEAIQVAFPAWSYGAYLDLIAAAAGLIRKAATYATGDLTITGTEGTTIPAGFVFATPSTAIAPNIEYTAEKTVVIDGTFTAIVPVKCKEPGPDGNVPANSITLMVSPISGIATINNEAAMTGGTEDESDDELRERIRERDLNNASSFVGNDADYKRWAKEVDGVGDVTVIPEWDGAGTGTVKLIVMDSAGAPASEAILDDVYDHIMSDAERDLRLAPIGAILTVATATLLPIDVEATLTLEDGAELPAIIAAFEAALTEHFVKAKEDGSVKYTRVGSLLSETEGVADYTGLTVNGGTANVTIGEDYYPSIGTTALTEAT